MREVQAFLPRLRAVKKAIEGLGRAVESTLATTRSVLESPLPATYVESSAGAHGAAPPLKAPVGGAGFRGDKLARASAAAAAQLEQQVLSPISRWEEAFAALKRRTTGDLEGRRLEVDSRRRTVVRLTAEAAALRKKAAARPGGADSKLEAALAAAAARLAHKEGKLARAAAARAEQEQAVFDDWVALARDAEWLRHYAATALKLTGEALLGAAAEVGDAPASATAGGGVGKISPELAAAALPAPNGASPAAEGVETPGGAGAAPRTFWARRGATVAPRAAPVAEVEAAEVDTNPFLAAPFTPEPRAAGATV
jgi:hypothetical protein